MADKRTARQQPIQIDPDYYSSLLKKRGIKAATLYNTRRLANPTTAQRASIQTIRHVWKYGDRYYKLADQYYGDVNYWWVIAWYNAYPTEAHISNGYVIFIPLNLEDTLNVLGV